VNKLGKGDLEVKGQIAIGLSSCRSGWSLASCLSEWGDRDYGGLRVLEDWRTGNDP